MITQDFTHVKYTLIGIYMDTSREKRIWAAKVPIKTDTIPRKTDTGSETCHLLHGLNIGITGSFFRTYFPNAQLPKNRTIQDR